MIRSLITAALLITSLSPVHAKRDGWAIPPIEQPPERYNIEGSYVVEFRREVMFVCPKEQPSFACTVPWLINGKNIGVKIVMPRPTETRFADDLYARLVAAYLVEFPSAARNKWIVRVKTNWVLLIDEFGRPGMVPDPRLFPESCYARALWHEMGHQKGFHHGEGVMVKCQK
jgi:hypothetical protein